MTTIHQPPPVSKGTKRRLEDVNPRLVEQHVRRINAARRALVEQETRTKEAYAAVRQRRAEIIGELRGLGLSLGSIHKRVGIAVGGVPWRGRAEETVIIHGPTLESREERDERRERLLDEMRILYSAPATIRDEHEQELERLFQRRVDAVAEARRATGLSVTSLARAVGVRGDTVTTWLGQRENRRKNRASR